MDPGMKLQTIGEVEYPETDGRPMGETDLHRYWMVRIIELLEQRFRTQRIYVSGNLKLYLEEGDPSRCVVPDAMVVKDCDPGRRRTFKVWEEGRVPNVVFETTSRSTKREDSTQKPKTYEMLGVNELFLYDPTQDYLRPALQGYRMGPNGYQPIEPDDQGRLESRELGLYLRIEDGDLELIDIQSGQTILTEAEAERAAREAAEAEVRRLRDELKRRESSG